MILRRRTERLLGIFLLISLLMPRIAYAQFSVSVNSDIQRNIERAIDEARGNAKQVAAGVAMSLLVNLVQFAANRLAYDTAVMISSGGNAEEPLFDGSTPADYFKDFGKAVAGQAIGAFQESMEAVSQQSNEAPWKITGEILSGFNVCAPKADIGAAISLGIRQTFERPEPICDFDDIQTNWQGFIARTSIEKGDGTRTILQALERSLDPSSNDFSISLNLYSKTISDAVNKADTATDEFVQNEGFQPVVDFITGNRETPASLISGQYKKSVEDAQDTGKENVKMLSANESAFAQVGIQAAQIFTNTLLSRLTQRLFDGAFKTQPKPDPFAGINSVLLGGRRDAQDQFRSYLAVTPLEVNNYSLVSDFVTCPPQGRGLYNCVINSSFATAIARSEAGAPMTLQEAIDEGFIDASWPLIPSSDQARNQDPYCYTYGFCHTNLQKLRKARVIPVGWELAAESAANNDEQRRVTLAEVMANFTNCNASGELDSEHPWCKLIDPNWVLKYPDTQCRAEVYGQLLELPGSDTRQRECVDMPSCVAENPDGTCAGYGYCTEEKNAWKFRGEACEPQFASCQTLKGPEGQVSYLMSTVDQTGCTEDTAGCRWYATEKVPTADGFAFSTSQDQPGIYLNGQVEKCSAADGGCRELIRRTGDMQLNMIANASFEEDGDTDTFADHWTILSGATADTADNAFLGSSALVGKTTGAEARQDNIVLGSGRYYTLSLYGEGTASASVRVPGVSFAGFSATGSCDIAGDTLTVRVSSQGAYTRASCTFTAPTAPGGALALGATVTAQATQGSAVDALELEQSPAITAFNEGYSAEGERLVAKVPPAYLGCRGLPTDPAECANYAGICSAEDVGCQAYTPDNGDPVVTGVATAGDSCPAECVGYDAYKQEPTKYEPAGIFPVSFIPDTAQTCSERDVGCTEFTSLADESLAYAVDLRQCSVTGGSTYYTWEGSDVTGYQLRTWKLLDSDYALASYTHAVSGEVDANPGAAPCTSFTATANGVTCNDTADADADGRPDFDVSTCDEHTDIFANPDCREFYDAQGVIHYRLWSKTITVDPACTPYRKSVAVDTAVCEETGGFFDAARGSCQYYGLLSESQTCKEAANNCRAYTGGRSRNSRMILSDNFENGGVKQWDAASANNVTYSNESLASGGHSLQANASFAVYLGDYGSVCTNDGGCTAPTGVLGGTCTVERGQRYCGPITPSLSGNKTYTLSFIAKGIGTVNVGIDTVANSRAPQIDTSLPGTDTVALTTEWQEYSLGPLDASSVTGMGAGSTLAFVLDGGEQMYLDNVILRQGEDQVALIANSWSTPVSCDTDPSGANSPGYYLGCRAYADAEGRQVNLKSFSRLCSEDKVGCDAFYLTQESQSPYAEIFLNNGSTLTVPADQDMFLVVTDEKRCDNAAAGCQELGAPTVAADRNSYTEMKSSYLVNDPDTYSDTLCGVDSLYCDAYTADDNTRYFFKNPLAHQCEYRTDVQLNNQTRSGWFIKGTDDPCYDNFLIGGSSFGLWKNGDSNYDGWVGACPAVANRCTEFQDPLDQGDGELYTGSGGQTYFYLDNASLQENTLPSERRCNGEVSLKFGCALFEDPGKPGKLYNASATEMLSQHADALLGRSKFAEVPPVSCGAAPNNNVFNGVDLCTQRCQYDMDAGQGIDNVLGGSCVTATDCAPTTNDMGEAVTGSCITAETLENDTDTILKVNRDRVCSEWLACYSTQEVWDERAGRYRSICEAVATCDEYSASALGGCGSWKFNQPAIALTAEQYAKRDVSWYGREMSGLSIPDQIGVEHLSQVDVAPQNACNPLAEPYRTRIEDMLRGLTDPDDIAYVQGALDRQGQSCNDDRDCVYTGFDMLQFQGICTTNDSPDYRLVYDAGSCSENEGEACTVGICSDSGAPCSGTAQCGALGGQCVTAQCLTPQAGASCQQDADCGAGSVCNGDQCARVDGLLPVTDGDHSCAVGQVTRPFVQVKSGVCTKDRCLLSPAGTSIADADIEQRVCRGYPEKNAPFSSSVVERWSAYGSSESPAATPPSSVAMNNFAYDTKDGFDRANLCVTGEDCTCNYRKLSFGQSNLLRYIGIPGESFIQTPETTKICTNAGDKQGMVCASNPECNTDDTADGRCERVKKEEVALGQLGYCLERDTGVMINGSLTEGACLSWLPVDRIAGATDLFAKSREAAFLDGETNYCSDLNFYANVGMAHGCSERPDDGGGAVETDEEARNACMHSLFACPVGMFAVVGAWDGSESPMQGPHLADWADSCRIGGGDSDNDCPFICVPEGATDSDTHQSCEESQVRVLASDSPVRVINVDGRDGTEDYSFNAYWVSDPEDFNTVVDHYSNCNVAGRAVYDLHLDTEGRPIQGITSNNLSIALAPTWKAYHDGLDFYGWFEYTPKNEVYLACEEYLSVQNENIEGAPRTNDLYLAQKSGARLSGMKERFRYSGNDNAKPFGAAETRAEILAKSPNPFPSVIAQCIDEEDAFVGAGLTVFDPPAITQLGNSNEYSCVDPNANMVAPEGFDLANPQARALWDFSGNYVHLDDIHVVATDSYRSATENEEGNLDDILGRYYARSLSLLKFRDGISDIVGDAYTPTAGVELGLPMSKVVDLTRLPADGNQVWDTRESQGVAPTVWAIDPLSCQGSTCAEGPANKITLNGKNEGTQEGSGVYTANVKFYAAANANQLPLRRVVVDWGDGALLGDQFSFSGDYQSTDNFFKNARGFTPGSDTPICSLDTEWGKTADSCSANYFQASHVYSCVNATKLPFCSTLGADRRDAQGRPRVACFDESLQACVFRPRVHVRDNWGFCSGTCAGGNCYAGNGSTLVNDGVRSNECDVELWSDMIDLGGRTTSPSTADPWAYYDGVVYVGL